jgi:HAE1 family hydrophobic/amphiphilic exporter-1
MSISERFIHRPVMTVVLTVSAVLFGLLAYLQLPVNDLPAVDYPVIQVGVGYPGATPETVAANIATPLERQFMQIPGLEMVTSRSSQGYCSMTLQFALSKSLDAAATDVQAAISRAGGSLPFDLPAPPTFTKTNPNDQPILYIALASDSLTQGQLYDLANTQVGQRISILSGVSQVAIYGTKSAVRIKADPAALAARGMSVEDLANAIRQGTTYQGAGQFDGSHHTFLLQPQGQLGNAEGYSNLIVAVRDNAPVYLKDVAAATDTVEDERVNMRMWVNPRLSDELGLRGGQVPKSTVVVAVFRQAGSNAVEVVQSIKDLVPGIKLQLPGSVYIVPMYDRSATIVSSINDVKETLLIAFALVVLVIYLFLGRATDTLIPVVALPMSLLLTFIVMKALDYSLDNLSLMALTLAIGFLVDDAIVFLENTVRRMEHFNESPMRAAINSAKEISFTILSMTLSLAAVFLPFVFMAGLMGRIFKEFAVTIVVAILASGLVSLTLTPLMCARSLGRRGEGARKTLVERISGAIERGVLRLYSRALWFFLRNWWLSGPIWAVCLAGTIYLLYTVPKSFLPVGDSSFVRGMLIAAEGTSPDEMHRVQERAETAMHANPAVDMTFTVSGVSRFLQTNFAFCLAFLKDPSQRPPIQAVTGQLQGAIAMANPGVIPAISPNPVLQISTGAASVSTGQFSYSVSGVDPKEVYAVSGKLIGRLMQDQGRVFRSVTSDMFLKTPNLRINILRDQASSYGVSASRIESLLRNAYSQNYIYLIKKPEDQYQVILETQDQARRSPEDLAKLYVRSDDGSQLVPLPAVATWEATVGPATVNHLNQFTSVTINFDVMPGVATGTAIQHVEDIAKQIVPPTLRGDFQGEALTFRQTMSSVTILGLLAIFVMYVILAILYESYVHPITVLSTLPTATVGGLLTLYLFGAECSLYAIIGLIMLVGIVKKNGIMIVDFAIQRVAAGETPTQSIHDASMDRFRPILMTTMAAIMGAVPIAFAWGTSGPERQPLGLVIVGGLLVSQLITLFITPVIYLYFEVIQEKVLNRIPFFAAHYEGHAVAAELEAPHHDVEEEPVAAGAKPVDAGRS